MNYGPWSFVRHKRLELSLLSEPDPKSGASTNSANAARVRQQDRDVDIAPLNQRNDLCLRSPQKLKFSGTPIEGYTKFGAKVVLFFGICK